MRPDQTMVVLGILALALGIGSLYAITRPVPPPPQETTAAALEATGTTAPALPVPGVDDSIVRVLRALGVIEDRPFGSDVPDVVGRTLAANGVVLILQETTGSAP